MYNYSNEYVTIFNEMFDDLFKGIQGSRDAQGHAETRASTTIVDGFYVLTAELPGVRKEDLSVTTEKDVVYIDAKKGEKKVTASYRIPVQYDIKTLDAELDLGVLTIRVKPLEVKKPERKTVKVR